MKTIIQCVKISLIVIVLASFATFASAEKAAEAKRKGLSLKDMVDQSELVFAGTVENIEYALSEPTGPDNIRIPHTFVTYRMDEVLAGTSPGDFVTLRFIGGLNPETMRYMSTSRTPLIDLEDQDILFVQGNTEKMCPLVEDFRGRLRVIQDQVYSETGRSILIDEKGSLKHGEKYRLEEVEKFNVQGRTFITKKQGPKVKNLPSNAVGAAKLKAEVKKLAKGRKSKKAFVDADPYSGFSAPEGTPAAPPSIQPL